MAQMMVATPQHHTFDKFSPPQHHRSLSNSPPHLLRSLQPTSVSPPQMVSPPQQLRSLQPTSLSPPQMVSPPHQLRSLQPTSLSPPHHRRSLSQQEQLHMLNAQLLHQQSQLPFMPFQQMQQQMMQMPPMMFQPQLLVPQHNQTQTQPQPFLVPAQNQFGFASGQQQQQQMPRVNVGRVLLVSNLVPGKVNTDLLAALFSSYGQVQRVKILYNKQDTALVQFASASQAARAMNSLHLKILFNKPVSISISKYNKVSLPKPGLYRSDFTKEFVTASHRDHHKNHHHNSLHPINSTENGGVVRAA